MIIAIDTREQRPYRFKGHPTETIALPTGDYSIIGYESRITIERKQRRELFQITGSARGRFTRELERMHSFNYAAIVCECSLYDAAQEDDRSTVSPKAVVNSLVSWSVRYDIPVWFAGSRMHAELLTLRLLEKWWKAWEG